jgi:hypothetical protein
VCTTCLSQKEASGARCARVREFGACFAQHVARQARAHFAVFLGFSRILALCTVSWKVGAGRALLAFKVFSATATFNVRDSLAASGAFSNLCKIWRAACKVVIFEVWRVAVVGAARVLEFGAQNLAGVAVGLRFAVSALVVARLKLPLVAACIATVFG